MHTYTHQKLQRKPANEEQAVRKSNLSAASELRRRTEHNRDFVKELPNIIAAATQFVGKRVMAGGRLCKATGVDLKTGALIVQPRIGSEFKVDHTTVTPL